MSGLSEDGGQYRGHTVPEVLTREECEILVDFIAKSDRWVHDRGPMANLDLSALTLDDAEVILFLLELKDKVHDLLIELYAPSSPIYADSLHFSRWSAGSSQAFHMDGHPKQFFWRDYGSIIYLNDDFTGGYTLYRDHDIEIVPKPGMLLVHPGDANHYHGVSEIAAGTRYTIPMFWTSNRKYKRLFPLED